MALIDSVHKPLFLTQIEVAEGAYMKFGPIGNTEKKLGQYKSLKLLRVLFSCFHWQKKIILFKSTVALQTKTVAQYHFFIIFVGLK